MIIEAAIGDAYGAGFEFKGNHFIKKNNNLTAYFEHGMYAEIKGRYTDDTQMAIAITELLLETEDWNEELVAKKFVSTFHRDKRRGYSNRVYTALDTSKNGIEFINNIDNSSSGNGSSMRAYPLGYLKDIEKLLKLCEIQAKVSHNTSEGIQSAKRIALAVHYYRYQKNYEMDLIEFINNTLKENEIYEVTAPIDMHGYPTTKAVIKIVSESNSLKDCLKYSIDFGGDTDTVAALCLAILSQKLDYKKDDLPEFLFEEFENGRYGLNYLKDLDKKLEKKYPKK